MNREHVLADKQIFIEAGHVAAHMSFYLYNTMTITGVKLQLALRMLPYKLLMITFRKEAIFS